MDSIAHTLHRHRHRHRHRHSSLPLPMITWKAIFGFNSGRNTQKYGRKVTDCTEYYCYPNRHTTGDAQALLEGGVSAKVCTGRSSDGHLNHSCGSCDRSGAGLSEMLKLKERRRGVDMEHKEQQEEARRKILQIACQVQGG